jgi:hypothetical protein
MSTVGAADLLSRDEIRAFTRRSDLAGALSILWTWLVIAGCFAALALAPQPAVFVGAVWARVARVPQWLLAPRNPGNKKGGPGEPPVISRMRDGYGLCVTVLRT